MSFLMNPRAQRSRKRRDAIVRTVEVLEQRSLLTAGITLSPAPTINATIGVPLNNVTVATFTVDDPNSVPGGQRRGHIDWGDGVITKMVVPTLVSGNLFAIIGSHTYSTLGTFTITVKVSVPMMPTTINTVTLHAIVSNPQPPPPPPRHRHVQADIDGNGQTDLVVYNPSTAVWSIRLTDSVGETFTLPFGTTNSIPLLGDLDGNGQADLITFDPNTAVWHIRLTNNGATFSLPFGSPHSVPLVGDVDGNGQSDLITFDPTTAIWKIRLTNNAGTTFSLPFGPVGGIPLVGDFDGNGQADLAVFDPNTANWSIRLTDNVGEVFHLQFGPPGGIPLLGDFAGDGHSDLAVYQPSTGTFFIRLTSNGATFSVPFGPIGGTPLLGDFDGNGQTDLVVYQPSTAMWSIRLTDLVGETFTLPFGPTNVTPVLPVTYLSTPNSRAVRGASTFSVMAGAASDGRAQLDSGPFVPIVTSEAPSIIAPLNLADTTRGASGSVATHFDTALAATLVELDALKLVNS